LIVSHHTALLIYLKFESSSHFWLANISDILANPFAPSSLQELQHYYKLVCPNMILRYSASRVILLHISLMSSFVLSTVLVSLSCWFPSSINKPRYSSCHLKDASRIASKQASAILITPYHTPWLLTGSTYFSTPHQWFIFIQLLYPYLNVLAVRLFLNAQYHSSLPQHL